MSADDSDHPTSPTRLDIGRAGTRYKTSALLNFRADHARAVDAVMTEVGTEWPGTHGLAEFHSDAATRDEYLHHPERGRRLRSDEIPKLKTLDRPAAKKTASKPAVLIFIGDGLSSAAVEAGAVPLLRALTTALRAKYHLLKPIFIRNARVRIENHLGEILRPDLVCMIVGERPGLATAGGPSASVIFPPRL